MSVLDIPNLRIVQGMVVGGDVIPAESGETIDVVDPSNNNVIARVPRAALADVERSVEAAREAFEAPAWKCLRPAERGRILFRIAGELRNRSAEFARLESLDVGKPLHQAYADVETAARYFEFYAGVADKILGSTIPLGRGVLDYTVREPIGVSAQIIPFNYPIQNTARGAAPALAAGCTVILKPSPEAPLSPLAVAALALESGLPPGVMNVIPGYGQEAGAPLAAHPGIDQITFTGSVATGISVAKAAADNVVPSVIELGGKSPSVVFADADFDLALQGVANSIFQNAGQTCSAGTRLLVEAGARESGFVERLVEHARGLSIGPGLEDPDLGPVVSARQCDRVESYLELAREEGADVLTGGRRASRPDLADGFFIEPTILNSVSNDARIAQEEIFGPVLTVIEFSDFREAARLANATQYGLSSSIWTRDLDRALSLASQINAGQVYVNGFGAGGGVELPFGGYKKSGWGREKGLEALCSYTQVKNVCITYREEVKPKPNST